VIQENSGNKLDPWFVTGFCEGEAAFTYSRGKESLGAYFSVRQRYDNYHIINKLQDFFGGIGKIYYADGHEPSKFSGHTKPSLFFRVTRVEELLKIVEHFEKFPLQGKKQEAFRAWKKLVDYKADYFRRPDRNILEELRLQVSVLNQKRRDRRRGQGNRSL